MWFKVDDNLAFHPKVVQARNPAMGLWVRAGSWVSQQLTDGFVPNDIATSLGSRKEIDRLTDTGLWLPTSGGFEFHQWIERNPTRVEVETQRSVNRRRSDLHRDATLRETVRKRDEDRCRYCGVDVDFRARRGPHRGTYDHVDPDGPNDVDNLVVACGPCNASKGHRTPRQAGMSLLPPPTQGGWS
jgi:hypothetical protein